MASENERIRLSEARHSSNEMPRETKEDSILLRCSLALHTAQDRLDNTMSQLQSLKLAYLTLHQEKVSLQSKVEALEAHNAALERTIQKAFGDDAQQVRQAGGTTPQSARRIRFIQELKSENSALASQCSRYGGLVRCLEHKMERIRKNSISSEQGSGQGQRLATSPTLDSNQTIQKQECYPEKQHTPRDAMVERRILSRGTRLPLSTGTPEEPVHTTKPHLSRGRQGVRTIRGKRSLSLEGGRADELHKENNPLLISNLNQFRRSNRGVKGEPHSTEEKRLELRKALTVGNGEAEADSDPPPSTTDGLPTAGLSAKAHSIKVLYQLKLENAALQKENTDLRKKLLKNLAQERSEPPASPA